MKYLSYLITVLMLSVLVGSCGQKEDDYYTQAAVTLQVPDTIVPLKIQGTVILKNLSNGRSYSISEFRETTVTIEVLRGSYMLDAEGTLLCRMPDGKEHVKYYRASENYIEIIDHPVQINTKIIFM